MKGHFRYNVKIVTAVARVVFKRRTAADSKRVRVTNSNKESE